MSLNLMQDRLVAVQSSSWTPETLNSAVAALLSEAEGDREVVAARVKLDAAQDYVATLTRRQVALNSRCIELNGRLRDSRQHLRDALAGGEVADVTDSQLHAQGQVRALYDGCSEGLQLVVAELLPTAQADALAADVDHAYVLADAIKKTATKQVEIIIGLLAPIAETYCLIEFDCWKIPSIAALLSEYSRILEHGKQGRESLAKIREQQKKKG